MKYRELYENLKNKTNYTDDVIEIDNDIVLKNFSFTSSSRSILPSDKDEVDNYEYSSLGFNASIEKLDPIQDLIHKTDAEIEENINFRYHILMPKGVEKSNKTVFFFHGFNEKYWDKYLPWAYHIVKNTGKSVLMFPIAFHMNRAPASWSDRREMYHVSEMRKERYPDIICSSLSNVAISSRLHNKPQRFIFSGVQTYNDVIELIESIKNNEHPALSADTSIDFFSYSIGTFLGEIIMMTNHNNYFSNSRYATFCGGAAFNRLAPVSKFILDSESNVALYSYVVEHLESHIKRNPKLYDIFKNTEIGSNFARMLNYNTEPMEREEKFRKMSDQFYAIALKQDKIIPFYEVLNTLQGSRRDIPIKVDILDYPYKYIHEDPFPSIPRLQEEVNVQFNTTFDKICNFLK